MEAADSAEAGRYVPDTLAHRLQSGPLPARQLYPVLRKVFDGLKTLHAAGFAHRDIKPDNILFVNGAPKLGDIGLLSSLSNSMTGLAGTFDFLPPEARPDSGDRTSRQRGDLYAFGKVIYCAATGLSPAEFPTVPTQERLSRELKLFLNLAFRLCARDPRRRICDVAKLADEIESLEKDLYAPVNSRVRLRCDNVINRLGERAAEADKLFAKFCASPLRVFILLILAVAICLAIRHWLLEEAEELDQWIIKTPPPEPKPPDTKVYVIESLGLKMRIPHHWQAMSEAYIRAQVDEMTKELNETDKDENAKKLLRHAIARARSWQGMIRCDLYDTIEISRVTSSAADTNRMWTMPEEELKRTLMAQYRMLQTGESRIYEIKRLMLAGKRCLAVDFTLDRHDRIKNCIFMDDDGIVTIALTADATTFARRRKEFDAMLQTLEFAPPAKKSESPAAKKSEPVISEPEPIETEPKPPSPPVKPKAKPVKTESEPVKTEPKTAPPEPEPKPTTPTVTPTAEPEPKPEPKTEPKPEPKPEEPKQKTEPAVYPFAGITDGERKMFDYLLQSSEFNELAKARLKELKETAALRKAGKLDFGDDPSRAREEHAWKELEILFKRDLNHSIPPWSFIHRIDKIRKDREAFAAERRTAGQKNGSDKMSELAAYLGWETYRKLIRSPRYGKVIKEHEAEVAAEKQRRKNGQPEPEPDSTSILEKKLWKNLRDVRSSQQIPYILDHIIHVRDRRGKTAKTAPVEAPKNFRKIADQKMKLSLYIPRNWVVAYITPRSQIDPDFSPDQLNSTQRVRYNRSRMLSGFHSDLGSIDIYCDKDPDWRDTIYLQKVQTDGGSLYIRCPRPYAYFAGRYCIAGEDPNAGRNDPDIQLLDLKVAEYYIDDGDSCILCTVYAKAATFEKRCKELEAALKTLQFYL